ncbi:MAG TPA: hypothetical protein VFS08_08385 [Gemmatimonadaceae bacterium]|nr:hypothetical protein [Gemmatimonadaceae bacterium]
MTDPDAPSAMAYIRRLSADGWDLYIRLDRDDVARLDLREGQEIALDVGGKVRIRGVVRATGEASWLAPCRGESNLDISRQLKAVGFMPGDDMPSRVVEVGPT